MHTTRRDLLKFASIAAAGAMLTPALRAYADELKHIPKAAKPLNLLILGGWSGTAANKAPVADIDAYTSR